MSEITIVLTLCRMKCVAQRVLYPGWSHKLPGAVQWVMSPFAVWLVDLGASLISEWLLYKAVNVRLGVAVGGILPWNMVTGPIWACPSSHWATGQCEPGLRNCWFWYLNGKLRLSAGRSTYLILGVFWAAAKLFVFHLLGRCITHCSKESLPGWGLSLWSSVHVHVPA